MASSTLRCTDARCDLCSSQNLLPAARTMSATSRVGRLIASSASWNASLYQDLKPRLLPADWRPPADGGGTDAGRVPYRRSWHGQAEPGWCAGREQVRGHFADEHEEDNDQRQPHSEASIAILLFGLRKWYPLALIVDTHKPSSAWLNCCERYAGNQRVSHFALSMRTGTLILCRTLVAVAPRNMSARKRWP